MQCYAIKITDSLQASSPNFLVSSFSPRIPSFEVSQDRLGLTSGSRYSQLIERNGLLQCLRAFNQQVHILEEGWVDVEDLEYAVAPKGGWLAAAYDVISV
jgi:hypothetical protein